MLNLALAAAFSAALPLMSSYASADTTLNGTFNSSYTNTETGNLTITSAAVISSSTSGIINTISTGIVTNNGSISGVGATALRNQGTILTLTNTSTITGNYGVSNTISNSSTSTNLVIGFINNSGLMQGANGNGLLNYGVLHQVNNTGTGTIASSNYNAIYNGFQVGTLNNAGLISTASNSNKGLYNEGPIILLNNTGTITGGTGVYNDQTIGTLTNSGLITSNSNVHSGMQNAGGLITSFSNTGTLSGATALNNSGTIGTLTNSGLISGANYAISNAGNGLGTLTNSGTIAGNLRNTSSQALTINGGTGSVYGVLTGAAGSIGTITNSSANLNFGTGNFLLNDHVNVGSNAVNNTAGVLQINNQITITGNYNQAAAATLLLGVANGAVATGAGTDSGYGRLLVNGNAALAAGSSVGLTRLASYGFAAGQRYIVVDATTATYNESALNYSATGYSGVIKGENVNNAGRADLVLTLTATPTPTPGPTPTPTPAPTPAPAPAPAYNGGLGGLQHYTGISDPALLNLYNASLAMSPTEAPRTNKQLKPTSTNSAGGTTAPALNVLSIVSEHGNKTNLSQSKEASGISTGESGPVNGLWGQAFGGNARQDERDQVDGYHANFGGLLFGWDRDVSDTWRAGAVVSYNRARIENTGDTDGDTSKIDSYGLVAYANYLGPQWYASISAGAVLQRYDTVRKVAFTGFSGEADGSFDGQQYVARADAGYPIALGGGSTITPVASLTYSALFQDDYTESNGNGAALAVDKTHSTSVTSDIGARLAGAYATSSGMLKPSLQLLWRHEYNHDKTQTNSHYAGDPTGETSFTSLGASPVDDTGLLSAGVTLMRANNLSLSARYDVQFGQGFMSQAGSLMFRQLF